MNASDEFDGTAFGDQRLNARCRQIADSVGANPSLSFPQQAATPCDLKGLYRFYANDQVTHEEILRPHLQYTIQRCLAEPIVLLIQDTSTLNFDAELPGLGLIDGSTRKCGMLMHNVYAVSARDKKPLGLVQQQLIVRTGKVAKKETSAQWRERKKESAKWSTGLLAGKAALPTHRKVIQVCDREADIYDFIKQIKDVEQGFVIRCAQNRSTETGKLFSDIAQAEVRGTGLVKIARNGNRKARTAQLIIKSCVVQLRPSQKQNRQGPVLSVNVVIAEEAQSPVGVVKLHWVLLTSEPVATVDDCWTVIRYYQMRWLIEDFHKGLKTGFQIEKRQLQTQGQLAKVLGMFSVLAYQLLLLRYCAQLADTDAGTIDPGLSEDQITILKLKNPKESEPLTPRRMLFLVAKLGGFIGRKSDGLPGWLTLMRGMYDLLLLEQGFIMGKELVGKG